MLCGPCWTGSLLCLWSTMKTHHWGELWMIFVLFVGSDLFHKFHVCKTNEIIPILSTHTRKRLLIAIKLALKKIGNASLWYACKLRIHMQSFLFGIVHFCSTIRIQISALIQHINFSTFLDFIVVYAFQWQAKKKWNTFYSPFKTLTTSSIYLSWLFRIS